MALPGRLQHRRLGDRLDDQDARRQLPPRRRAAQSRSSRACPRRSRRSSARTRPRSSHRRSTLRCRRPARSLPAWSAIYHETLKQIARSVAVSRSPRPRASGDDRSLQAGLRQPHARPTGCRRRTARPGRSCAAVCSGSASCARERPRALERLHGVSDFRRSPATCSACTAARSRRACARARRCISTCRDRIEACGTKRRWRHRRRSSCANRSSTR